MGKGLVGCRGQWGVARDEILQCTTMHWALKRIYKCTKLCGGINHELHTVYSDAKEDQMQLLALNGLRTLVNAETNSFTYTGRPTLDLFDGHFFGAMEWLMFFSRAPSALMVFQWFCQRWTITIKCFLTSRPSTSMVFRWFSDFLGRWLTMVLKFQGYKKCVNSTRDKMCFRNAGERITALNSFRRAESYERGTDRDLIFLEIGTKSNRNPGRPKQGPNNAHLVEYSNMGPRFLQIETHQWAVGNDNQWNLQKQYNT